MDIIVVEDKPPVDIIVDSSPKNHDVTVNNNNQILNVTMSSIGEKGDKGDKGDSGLTENEVQEVVTTVLETSFTDAFGQKL